MALGWRIVIGLPGGKMPDSTVVELDCVVGVPEKYSGSQLISPILLPVKCCPLLKDSPDRKSKGEISLTDCSDLGVIGETDCSLTDSESVLVDCVASTTASFCLVLLGEMLSGERLRFLE